MTAVCRPDAVELVGQLVRRPGHRFTATDFTRDRPDVRRVFDAVGKSTFGRAVACSSRTHLPFTDLGPGPEPGAAVGPRGAAGRRACSPSRATGARNLLRVRALLEAGRFPAVIDRTYPLDDIVEAYRYVESAEIAACVIHP